MTQLASTNQQWEESVLSSFLDMVRAPDGDFPTLDRLIRAVSDRDSLLLMVELLSRHPQGKAAFENRPRLGNLDLVQLQNLPENTLGYAYADHLLSNGLKPLQAQEVESDFHFLNAHITETHDIWHIVTGCNTNILGEIQLEAFYVAQLEFSRFWLSLLAKNLLKAVVYDIELSTNYMEAIAKGWVMGKQAKPLFGIAWNTLWATPLSEVRESLNIAIL
jgi:ubiquinone biosynthesis protein Coq4